MDNEQFIFGIEFGAINGNFLVVNFILCQLVDCDGIGADIQIFRMQRNVLCMLDHINLVLVQPIAIKNIQTNEKSRTRSNSIERTSKKIITFDRQKYARGEMLT